MKRRFGRFWVFRLQHGTTIQFYVCWSLSQLGIHRLRCSLFAKKMSNAQKMVEVCSFWRDRSLSNVVNVFTIFNTKLKAKSKPYFVQLVFACSWKPDLEKHGCHASILTLDLIAEVTQFRKRSRLVARNRRSCRLADTRMVPKTLHSVVIQYNNWNL